MLTRRSTLALMSTSAAAPYTAWAATPREISWDDLIPPGVPYSEIIGEGQIDAINDTWNPIYDENATKFNDALNGAYVKMPGYIIPIEFDGSGTTEFILVPYVGACIHVPPPPANQLILVTTQKPWPTSGLWEAIWVTGTLTTQLQSTELADIGYALSSDSIEIFEW